MAPKKSPAPANKRQKEEEKPASESEEKGEGSEGSSEEEGDQSDEQTYDPLIQISKDWFDSQFGSEGLQVLCGNIRGKLLGGHQYSARSIYLECKCGNEAQHKTNSSRTIYDLETWVMCHCLEDITDTLTDDQIEMHVMQSIKVHAPDNTALHGKSLLQFCQQRTEDAGGPLLAGQMVWILWWQEINSGKQVADVTKTAITKGTAYAGGTAVKDQGVWFQAEVVGYDEESGRLHVFYPSDQSFATLLYPLDLIHWGNKPPGKASQTVNPTPQECVPPPLTGASATVGLTDMDDSESDDDDALMRIRHGVTRSIPSPSKVSSKTHVGSEPGPSKGAAGGALSDRNQPQAKRPPRPDAADQSGKKPKLAGQDGKQGRGGSQAKGKPDAPVPPPMRSQATQGKGPGSGRAGSGVGADGAADISVEGGGKQGSGSEGSALGGGGKPAVPPKRPGLIPGLIVRSPRERLCELTKCPWDVVGPFAKPVNDMLTNNWNSCSQLELDFCRAPLSNQKWFKAMNNNLVQATGYERATLTATLLPEGKTPGIREAQYGYNLERLQAALKAVVEGSKAGEEAALQQCVQVHRVCLGHEPSLLTQLITSDPTRGCQRSVMMYHVNPGVDPSSKSAVSKQQVPSMSDAVSFLVQTATDQQRNLAVRIPVLATASLGQPGEPAAAPAAVSKVVLPPSGSSAPVSKQQSGKARNGEGGKDQMDPAVPEGKRSTCVCVVCGYWYMAITTVPDVSKPSGNGSAGEQPNVKFVVRIGWFKSEPLLKLSGSDAAAGKHAAVKHVCKVVSTCMLQLGLLFSAIMVTSGAQQQQQEGGSEEDKAKQQAEVLLKCLVTCNDLVAEATPSM